MAKASACSHGRLGTARRRALGSVSRSGKERGELGILSKGYGARRNGCAPGRCSGLWLPEPRGGFRRWYHPVHALVLALLPEHLPPAAPWPEQHGRARVVQLTGQGSRRRAFRQSSVGQFDGGQCQDLRPRLLRSCRCVAGVERGGLLASTLLGAVGQGRLGLGFGSSVPLERVLAELRAPSVAGRRDGQREGRMRAMEGTSLGYPEPASGSAGSPCARTRL